MKPSDSKPKNPHKRKRDFKSYLLYVMTAILLIFVVDEVLWDGERPYITQMKEEYYAKEAAKASREQEIFKDLLPPQVVYPEDGTAYFEAPVEEPPELNEEKPSAELKTLVIEEKPEKKTVPIAPKIIEQAPVSKIITKPSLSGKPKIAIVIDDVGMNLTQSRAAINLDPNVTIAFLPYAEKVKELALDAKTRGNEIIIHAPMEAMNADINLGPMGLRAGMNPNDFTAEFQKISESFDGYVGVNNHMGSRLTQDKQAMGQLMRLLKAKDLYFLDSKTISTSIAAETAAFYGVPYAVRDVFLDHEDTPEFVEKALRSLERVATKHGSAIAIGHPKKNTMMALKAWIPTLESKGFELVPLSTLIQKGAPLMQAVKQDVKSQTIEGEEKTAVKPKIIIEREPSSSRVLPTRLNFQLPE